MTAPRWELHIRPMFNLQDWDHMRSRIDFSDADSVWTFKRDILDRLKSSDPMPPKPEGGPWPPEWIELFERWVIAGESEFGNRPPRLTVGHGTDYRLTGGFGKWRLTGSANVPSDDTKAWLHLVGFSESVQTLTLFFEEPPNPSGPGSSRPLLAFITPSPSLQEIVVIDSGGENRLPRPGPGT